MKENNRIKIADVIAITNDYCEIMNGDEYETISCDVNLIDGDGLNQYTTIICCKKEDLLDAELDITQYEGKNIEDYRIKNKYCHIATYKSTNRFIQDISFDDNEECNIHANYNKEYKNIENFFKNFIKFRNNLIKNKQIVKEDDCYQYFLSVKKGFSYKNKKISKRKIKRVR